MGGMNWEWISECEEDGGQKKPRLQKPQSIEKLFRDIEIHLFEGHLGESNEAGKEGRLVGLVYTDLRKHFMTYRIIKIYPKLICSG